jgi:hypothetical protein
MITVDMIEVLEMIWLGVWFLFQLASPAIKLFLPFLPLIWLINFIKNR